MTNHIHAKAKWLDGTWRALVRYSHKADYWPVMDGDRPAAYPTKDAAEIAALRAQEKHINGTITGFGDKVEAARTETDKLFRLGKKPIDLETKRRARA
ncbi:hypothetical protein [Pseudaminobacter sp. NGMCC 1.201702]|uniref:hypothetical protein n=1 Tax=Pseudaminobacter sp. NGMCC 1.201702 TaxID=3391825 RepID=UPI0039F10A75